MFRAKALLNENLRWHGEVRNNERFKVTFLKFIIQLVLWLALNKFKDNAAIEDGEARRQILTAILVLN